MVVALIPTTALAADPVITNLSATRESETKATLSFHSAESGYIYITVKDSDELTPFTLFMPLSAGEQVITLENDPYDMTPWFTNAGEAQVAVCFGNNYQELKANLENHNNDPFAAEGVVTATIPAAANSTAPEVYDLWVNGTQVTSDNAGNVLGDDTVSYDAASTTLTLNGANLTDAQHTDYDITATIFADQSIGTLTINSVGQNTVSATASGITAGIYCYGDIVFTGSGSLTVTANSTGSEGNAVYAHTGDVTINSGTYSFTGIGAGQAGVESGTGYGVFAGSGQNRVIVHGGTVTMVGKPDTDGTAIHGILDTSGYAGCSVKASLHSDGSDAEDYDAETLGYKYIRIWSPDGEVYDENGLEIGGPGYQPAEQVDGVYQIKNAGNLFWFAEQVKDSSFGEAIDAELTNNIVIPDDRIWSPIALADNSFYTGTFDGDEYTISGIRTNGSQGGLFRGITADSVVKNLGIINSVINSGSSYGGAIAGTNYGTIENCYNTGTVMSEYGANMGIGGIAGWNYGTIRECYNAGTIDQTGAGADGAGGICGRIRKGAVVEDCYNTGEIHSYYDAGGIVGYYSDDDYGFTIKNCYNIGSVSSDTRYWNEISSYVNGPAPEGDITNCYYLADTETVDGGRTDKQFASGEVAWLLNSGKTDGSQAFYQTCGEGYPVFSGQTVYQIVSYQCPGDSTGKTAYSNMNQATTGEHSFTQQDTDEKYLKSAATCESAAIYYLSCESCGAASETETFSYGEKNPDNHAGEPVWTITENTHISAYSCCGVVTVAEEPHEWKNNMCVDCGYRKAAHSTDAEEDPSESDEGFSGSGGSSSASGPEGSDDKKTPATGDGSNPAFWAILFAASGAVLIGAVAYDRKREYNE